ncbi:MAG TPA: hypothetical protein VFL36_15495 [Myxococcales bacterium]|nr:hypothetical protein [Myxococcales bacterium]
MKTLISTFCHVLGAALFFAAACEKPGVAPGLDQLSCDGGPCPAPGVIQGSLVYSGTARGDAVLLLFDTAALPPPDGNGTSAAALARVSQAELFGNAPATSIGPFSAQFTFSQVPSGRSYQIRAFIDATHEFDPFFDFARQPRAGDPAGGHGEIGPDGQPRLVAIDVAPGQAVSGVSVALTQTVPYDPPSFELAGGSQTLSATMDRPARLRLRIASLGAKGASFSNAHFGLELDRDAQGKRQSSFSDGLDDVFPRVILRQFSGLDAQGKPVPVDAAAAAIVPCRVVSTPVLPALVNLAAGAVPMAQDQLDVLVQPLAVDPGLKPLPAIPPGAYQVVVIEKSGQVWTVPNQLGDPSLGPAYFSPSQVQSVTFAPGAAPPPGSISGDVVWQGDTTTRSGNIIVQAYRDDPFNPPPPVGAALPVRVQAIPAAAVQRTTQGFRASYKLAGLPAGNYVVQALDDVDGNFSPLSILMTPTRGDLVGAVLAAGSTQPASIAVSGAVTGKDVTLAVRVPLDPPAFEIDPATPAQMPADQVTPVRFNLRSKPLAFPAGQAPAPHFAVQLVRDSGGSPVDADHDGLPDVWPRAFLVRLDPADPSGLTQFISPDLHQTVTEIIPAAVDPTPFLPALQPQTPTGVAPVLTDKLSIVVRPSLLDASTALSPPQRLPSLQPGSYKIVLVSQTGQVWQIPNEAGTLALDPSVVCAAGSTTCAAGTVQTQSQSQAFQVGLPAHQVFTGGISGSLTIGGAAAPVAAYVFAYKATALPPFGLPVSADFHLGAEFQAGKVDYVLPDLPAGDYVVTAIVDTRGDFAVSPGLFAIAPGAGSLVAAPQGKTVGTSLATSTNLTAASTLPQRPSFQIVDAAGAAFTSDAAVAVGASPVLHIKAAAVLGSGVGALRPDSAGMFVLACDGTGTPQASSLSVTLIKVLDAAGLVPDLDANGKATIVPASVDQAQFPAGSCSGAVQPVTGVVAVNVQNGSAKANLLNPNEPLTPVPLVPGRYSVVVTSLARQVWRVPNELQPALLDAGAAQATPTGTKSLLQTQGVAVQISP